MVVGILALIFYNDQSVKEYFARINGAQVYGPVTTPTPPIPASTPDELLPSSSEPVLPEPELMEEPAKPKRIRKVAGK